MIRLSNTGVLFVAFAGTGCSDRPQPVSTTRSTVAVQSEPRIDLTPDQIQLPARPKPEEVLDLTVNADGNLVIPDGSAIKDLGKIKEYVEGEAKRIRSTNSTERVVVRLHADTGLPFARVQSIMDLCRACGIVEIQLRALKK